MRTEKEFVRTCQSRKLTPVVCKHGDGIALDKKGRPYIAIHSEGLVRVPLRSAVHRFMCGVLSREPWVPFEAGLERFTVMLTKATA